MSIDPGQRSGPERLLGVVPAAGIASRLPRTAGSKELVKVPLDDGEGPVAACLLRAMRAAGVERTYVVLRSGKWDIPTRLGDGGSIGGPPIAYLTTNGTSSIPATLNIAVPFVAGATVVTGFPDAWFQPADALRLAVEQHRAGRASITLALFPSDRPDKTDMVELEGDRVVGLRVKPGPCRLEFTFGGLVWSPEVTRFLSRLVADADAVRELAQPHPELQVSQVLMALLREGVPIDGVRLPAGRYIDVGTPDDLERVRSLAGDGRCE